MEGAALKKKKEKTQQTNNSRMTAATQRPATLRPPATLRRRHQHTSSTFTFFSEILRASIPIGHIPFVEGVWSNLDIW